MRTKRSLSAAILGVAIATGTIAAPGALAPISTAQTASNIDTAAPASLTIHKFLNPTRTEDPTGNAGQDNEDTVDTLGTPLEGIQFTITPITGYDIGTNEGFAALRALTADDLTPNNLPPGVNLGTPTVDTTGPDGTITANLPVGAYLVEETDTSGARANGEEVAGEIIPSQPFIVFLPMTNPDDTTQWNYNVHVYPKNSSADAVKTVDDADGDNLGYNVGDEIFYTLTTGIPSVPTGGTMTVYRVEDVLPSEVSISDVQLDQVDVSLTGTDVTLDPADYTVTRDPADTQKVIVTFTQAGLAKLTQAGSAAKVETTIPVTVLAIGDDDGIILNTGTVIFNNGTSTSDTTVETNEVETRLGKLRIVKHEEGNTEVTLEGAEFQLYRCGLQTPVPTLIGAPLKVNDAESWTTGKDGTVTIDGLHVTDFADSAGVTVTYQYCLVETKAPAGYELLPDPVPVSFTTADVRNTEDGTDAVTQIAQVANTGTTSTNLPSTGGIGVGILMALGAGIIGLGAWAAKRASRKA